MNDKAFMKEALKEADKAREKGEVPIGAVIVVDGEIVARAHNTREHDQTVLAHAELIAIDRACKALNMWRLEEATVYVTLEPCPMCAGAIIQSRIKRVVYGATDPKHGAHASQVNLFDVPFNHRVEVESGVLALESSEMLKAFFNALRTAKNTL